MVHAKFMIYNKTHVTATATTKTNNNNDSETTTTTMWGVLQQQQRQHQQSHIIAVRPKYAVKLPVNQLVTGYK